MIRCLEIAAVLAAGIAACAPGVHAQTVQLTTEEAMVDSPQAGLKIYVRNKHPADMGAFTPERTLLFVHGAPIRRAPPSTLSSAALSWMDYIARRGFDVYLMDLPGYGASTRPAAMDEPRTPDEPFETTADAVRDYAAVVDWVLARRHLDKLDVMGWSWGTTIAGGFAAEQPMKVNRLVLYAPVWVPQDAPTAGEPPKLGAYRMVTRAAALQRWLKGVPESKRADLIPPGWFDAWQRRPGQPIRRRRRRTPRPCAPPTASSSISSDTGSRQVDLRSRKDQSPNADDPGGVGSGYATRPLSGPVPAAHRRRLEGVRAPSARAPAQRGPSPPQTDCA